MLSGKCTDMVHGPSNRMLGGAPPPQAFPIERRVAHRRSISVQDDHCCCSPGDIIQPCLCLCLRKWEGATVTYRKLDEDSVQRQ